MNDVMVTVFTPTYNRKNELRRLYNSLKRQTCSNFIWLIVDDGSTDSTEKIVKKWVEEKAICIQYVYQKNSGKSVAHNVGVGLTETELFTCVDSDDYLSTDAIEKILEIWNKRCKGDIGILAKREVTKLTKNILGELHTTLRNAYKKYGIRGDTMLIFKSDIIKKYRFPEYIGEKFVPENYLYDLMDQEGTLFFLNEVLYCGEYLNNGYTSNMVNVLKNNPNGYIAYILQRVSFDKELSELIPDLIRYIAMAIYAGKKEVIKSSNHSLLCTVLMPAGYIFYLKRYKKTLSICER